MDNNITKKEFIKEIRSRNAQDELIIKATRDLLLVAKNFQDKVINKHIVDLLDKIDDRFRFHVVRSGNSFRFTIFLLSSREEYMIYPVNMGNSTEEVYIRENRRLAFGSLALAVAKKQKDLRRKIEDRDRAVDGYNNFKHSLDIVNSKMKEIYDLAPECLKGYMRDYQFPAFKMFD
ncbi:MAG: hypothetical protein PUD15_01150 [Prevotella sp.]|nr:hypothetical protein [Prevotella sp.]